ncbi:methylenetetrahydrofolate reductase [Desulforudis sp. DRI-14]|uniref:methylenetetrahydrofolate reductase n=1 Tax=Desulforudis sp. DRI-14 TaxID=3459793 RepID=UPI004041B645
MNSGGRLEKALAEREFAVTAEIGPPRNASGESVRAKARLLKGFVHAANVTDCQSAVVRLASLAAALHVQAEGVEAVWQMTCRDRNRIAMQSDLLGAASLGIKNVLCLTGDHQKFGNHPAAKNVFDLDSVQMVEMVRRMRDDGRFDCGDEIKGPLPRFLIGAVENATAEPTALRLLRLRKKVAAGAQFIQTQGVFDLARFEVFMREAADAGILENCRLLAGVIPLKSARAARFMNERVPGVRIPDEVVRRMEQSRDQEEEGIRIAVETVDALRRVPGVAGVHLMAVAWEEAVPRIVSEAGIKPLGDR